MPFLNQVRRWADEAPRRIAVGVCRPEGTKTLTYAQLADAATASVGSTSPTVLCAPNSLELVVDFIAAVAGTGVVAVLDPSWPAAVRNGIAERLATLPAPAGASSTHLADGGPDSPFLIGLTSGTSSVPKAFRRTRRSWQESFRASVAFLRLDTGDVTLAPGPLSASVNLYALAECLYAGSTFYLLPGFSRDAALGAIRSAQVTRLVLVPAMLRLLARNGAAVPCPRLRTIVCAGAKLDPQTAALARRWAPNATLVEYYGASELGFIAGQTVAGPLGGRAESGDGAAHQHAGATAVGTAFPGVEISIRDEDGRDQPVNTIGSIYVRSALVSNGYLWGDDGQAFARDGNWCTVRDQGYLTDAGVLHVMGRASDMLLCGGHNVYPQEVEAVLGSVPGVAAAVVTGMPDDVRGHRIAAGILAIPDGPGVDGSALRAAARSALAPYKRPGAYFVLGALPTTKAGKVSRALLRDWMNQGDDRVGPRF